MKRLSITSILLLSLTQTKNKGKWNRGALNYLPYFEESVEDNEIFKAPKFEESDEDDEIFKAPKFEEYDLAQVFKKTNDIVDEVVNSTYHDTEKNADVDYRDVE